jgi:hypothetical protein
VFKDREDAAEGRAMKEHDKVLLEKLKAKLRAEQGADNKRHVEVGFCVFFQCFDSVVLGD